MLLLFLLKVFTVFFEEGSCYERHIELCYGRDFRLLFGYTPPLYNGPLYFNPSNGGPRRILMDNGKSFDPRTHVSSTAIYLKDVTEEYDGYFSLSFDGKTLDRMVTMKILDCAEHITRNYGYTYEYRVPTQAEFMEFTPPQSLNQPKILWNRADPDINTKSRGRVTNNVWKISDLTQKDNGYYNFRQNENNRLVSRIRLTVEELSKDMRVKVGNVLHIVYPDPTRTWSATFTPEGKTEHETMIKDGRVSQDFWFNDRIQCVSDGIEVAPSESMDSGTFDFRDSEDNLVLTVRVEVESGLTDILLFVLLLVILPIAIICCCCYCCKKKCGKKNQSPPPTSTAPAVSYHDNNQPPGPSDSAAPSHSAFSHQPVNPHVPTEPTFSDDLPPEYHTLNINTNPTQPEVVPPGRPEAAPVPHASSDCLSSGNEPHFEVKGMTFPSAPPLDSDSTFSDVYTSDKLNFL